MTSAYVLIAAVILLGALLAALGDRLGSKVGKARLRLFKLRPRQTAIVVTTITGAAIALSTLAVLFATSKSLRQGVFQLDEIHKKRRDAQRELARVRQEKTQVEQALLEAQNKQGEAQKRLNQTNQNFQQAQALLKSISQQTTELRAEVQLLLTERQQLLQQRNQLKGQITQLQAQVRERDQELARREQEIKTQEQRLEEQKAIIAQKNQEITQKNQRISQQDQELREGQARLKQLEDTLQQEIAKQDQVIKQLDKEIITRDIALQTREARLEDLENQLGYLRREVAVLEQYYQNYQALRQGSVALVRGQLLASGVVRIVNPSAASKAVDQLLRQANQTVTKATRSGNTQPDERVLQITESQVEQLVKQIQDGGDYVVRILSAGNYVEGEEQVRVFADVALNQKIFDAGEVLAEVSLEPGTMTQEEIQKQLDLLLAASQFRARRAGILGNIQVEDGRIATVIGFIEKLNQSAQPIDQVQAIVSEPTYTSGPLKIQLVALRNGNVVFST